MSEKVTQQQALTPAEKGLEAVLQKMDGIADTVTANAAKVAEALEAAKKAQEEAEKAKEEAVKAANTLPINFAKTAEEKKDVKTVKAEKNAAFRDFLNNVKAARYGNNSAKAALQSGAATGSYLVPVGFVPELIDLLEKYPSYVTEARRIPWGASGNTRHIPNLISRPAVAIIGEGETKPISNPAFGQIEQHLHKLVGAVVVTRELIEDAAIDLIGLLPDLIAPSFVDALNTWLFSGQGVTRPGIFTASGVHTPTVNSVSDLLNLKFAVPAFVRATGKFYVANDVYTQLASLTVMNAHKWLTYSDGVMKIDGSEVVNLDAAVIGANGRACFGNINNVILSPKTPSGFAVKYSDQATMVEGTGDDTIQHNFFQENKEGWIFEARTELTVLGSVWAKANLSEESESGSN